MEKYTVEWHYDGFHYVFHTLDFLFSYRQVDLGTRQMIEYIDLQPDSKVLDLECGYGVVGIWAAHMIGSEKVVMSDVNIDALEMAAENVKANNLDEIQNTNFSVAKAFIEDSYRHLQSRTFVLDCFA